MLSGVRLIDDKEGNRRKDRTKDRHKRHEVRQNKDKRSRRRHRQRESEDKGHEDDDRGHGLDRVALLQGWDSDKDNTRRLDEAEIVNRQGDDIVVHGDAARATREDWMTMPLARPAAHVPVEETREEKVHGRLVTDRHIRPEEVNVEEKRKVGDGGASWRMKALKRAQVQASVEGKTLSDVVGERWGSVKELASQPGAAPEMAHYHATRQRRQDCGMIKPRENGDRDRMFRSGMERRMKKPDAEPREAWRKDFCRSGRDRASWRKRNSSEYSDVINKAAPHLNSFENDGSFMDKFETKADKSSSAATAERHDEDNTNEAGQRSSEKTNETETVRKIETDDDLVGRGNLSAAALLRARLTGKKATTDSGEEKRAKEVVLPMVDDKGRAAPGAFGRETLAEVSGSVRPQKRIQRYKDGEKTRYFAEDDAVDLDTMVKRTKYQMEDDMDDVMARNIIKKSRFKDNELNAEDEYDFDAGLEYLEGQKVSKQSRRRGDSREELARKEKARQIRDYKRLNSALEKCRLCFASSARKKHLTVSVGMSAYLALPERGRLVAGHCCIIPIEHLASSRIADENTWDEMRNFKKCLLQMYASQGMDSIFFETALKVQDSRSHAVVECLPLPKDAAAKAPMYFKKAIDDATSDWSQHSAKRFIETESRNLQRKIPPNFPYFHVEFGLASGFVHVIDDPDEFDPLFARRVIIGLLRLPEESMHQKSSREGEGVQRQWVSDFSKQFSEFDWTSQL